jgi:hypothetical protein
VTREAFEHVVRAAGSILGTDEVLIIGSQALHASVDSGLPPEAERSIEVDVAVPGDTTGEKADLIDGSIGELSMFHETFGYYAQGVVETTAVLPRGWRDRLVRFETPSTNKVVAWCLEPHDLWIAKAIANRPQDVEFCDALLRDRIVRSGDLETRLDAVSGLGEPLRALIRRRISSSM